MWGMWLGIPLAVVAFLATDHYVTQWDLVGDRLAIDGLGVSLGLCLYFVARGIDVFLNEKRDNPPSFNAGKTVPEAFGAINQLLTEGMYGPFSWSVKVLDSDETRIVAVMKFTELLGTGIVVPPTQAQRLVMLQVLVDPIPEEEQKEMIPGLPDHGKYQSRIDLKWRVDSPFGRGSINKLQDDMTYGIKQALGLVATEKPKPKSPFEPPEWVLILVLLAIVNCVDQSQKYDQRKKDGIAQQQARQAEIDRAEADRAEANRKAAQEQAQRDAYRREMDEKYRQAQEAQQRGAEQLLQQQRQQSQYSAPYSTPVLPNNSPLSNPFTQPLSPGSSNTNSTPPWRSRFGGGNNQ